MLVNRPDVSLGDTNVNPDLVNWDAIVLLSHKLLKFIQTVRGKAAALYKICSLTFQ